MRLATLPTLPSRMLSSGMPCTVCASYVYTRQVPFVLLNSLFPVISSPVASTKNEPAAIAAIIHTKGVQLISVSGRARKGLLTLPVAAGSSDDGS